jgi:hypothetical protein
MSSSRRSSSSSRSTKAGMAGGSDAQEMADGRQLGARTEKDVE